MDREFLHAPGLAEAITRLSQAILKREWERVKSGTSVAGLLWYHAAVPKPTTLLLKAVILGYSGRIGIAFALLAIPFAASAQRTDATGWLTATAGYGQRVAVYGIGAMWHMPWGEEMLARHGLDARIGVDVMRWDGPALSNATSSADTDRLLWNGNVTPYLRWHPADGVWRNTFIELGIGVQVLSGTSITSTPTIGATLAVRSSSANGLRPA